MEPAQGDKPSQLMIDATHLKARRTAASLLKKGLFPDVCDGQGRPLVMLLGEGQMSDYRGAAMLLDALPCTKALLDDQGYDADWFRKALAERNITACIPSKKNRKVPIPHDPCSIASATRSRICSAGSRTGGASTPATTDAPTPSCPPSASP